MRTPFANVRGERSVRGDAERAQRLGAVLHVTQKDAPVATRGPHGLHPFPGRLHPLWARRAIEDLPRDAVVVDPFCGGGTVLVEARLSGLRALGSDLHPLAVRLSRLKTGPAPDLALLEEEAARCMEGARARRETPFSKLAQAEKAFMPQVLGTLISLRDEVEHTEDPRVREVLLFSLTPLLDKLSARSDRAPVAMSTHVVREHFFERAMRWREYFELCAQRPTGRVEAADARALPWDDGAAGAVVTSPPYPGVYDYAGAQARWSKWLGVGRGAAERAGDGELGRARTLNEWGQDMSDALAEMARVVRPGGSIYLFVADGVLQQRAVRVDAVMEQAAEGLPLRLSAVASETRPHFHGPTARAFERDPRREHAILFLRE